MRARSTLRVSLLAAVTALVASCSSRENPGDRGAQCFRIEDCKEGLVCVKQQCTDNLDGIQITLTNGDVANINLAATPEPGSFVLFGLGAIGLFVAARRRRAA